MGSVRRAAEESINHLIPTIPLPTPFLDENIITLIQRHLELHDSFKPWGESPRLFILLRMLKCDENVLQQFLSANVNDFWLPIDENAFKKLGIRADWDGFRQAQRYLLSNPEHMSEEKLLATSHVHHHLEHGQFFFKDKGHIAHGATASVLRVQHITWDNAGRGSYFACKRAVRGKLIVHQREHINLFLQELQILRRISHPHTVRLVASYTDNLHFALVLQPLADGSLQEFLHNATAPLPDSDSEHLRHWFGCLVSALSYLHEECIRHKDIKPSNIVLSNEDVYLCDFGISNDWTGSDPTTEGPSYLTPGYCSPEVWRNESRNDASDVWSMGRVFCDMFTVLAGRSLTDLLRCIGTELSDIYKDGCLEKVHEWLRDAQSEVTDPSEGFLLEAIQQMMLTDRISRPEAKKVLSVFQTRSAGSRCPLIGQCCQKIPSIAIKMPTQGLQNIGSPQGRVRPPDSALRISVEDDIQNLSPQRPPALSNNRATDEQEYEPQPIEWTHARHSPDLTVLNGSETSPSSSFERRSTVTDRRISLDDSSTRSPQLVKCSSGSVLALTPTPVESISTCNCLPRELSAHDKERLLIRIDNVALSINVGQPTVETDLHCGLQQDTLLVYESYSRPGSGYHKIWLKTRRLVVSYRNDAASRQECSSFWLPLTDLTSDLRDSALTLRWSDCNHWSVQPLRNNKQSCDCVYNPDNPNNDITLAFVDPAVAITFLDSICAVYNRAEGVKEWRNIDIEGQQRLLVVDILEREVISYRLACLALCSTRTRSIFQVFIHWPTLDLDIQIQGIRNSTARTMTVRFDSVSTPNYASNVVNEPWIDNSKIGRFSKSNLVFSSYSMKFPYGMHTSASLPAGVRQTFEYLTGWSIRFFASNVQLAKDKFILDSSYGVSDVMLWQRVQSRNAALLPEVRITFRHRRAKPNYTWRTGVIDTSRSPKFSLTTAEITMSGKAHGDLLDTTSMTAVNEKGNSSTSAKSTKVEMQFDTSDDLTALVKVFDDLQKVARADSLMRAPTNTNTMRLSRDRWRRDSNHSSLN